MEQAQKDFMQVMLDGAPERKQEIKTLWDTYNPKVIFENNGALTLNATSERIKIDFKMVDVFWLIGFSGWRAIETYFPNVIYAVLSNQRVAVILQQDTDLDEMERNYKERIAAVHTFIESRDVNTAPWPPDIPRPSSNRDALNDPQYQAAFDLTMSAVAFTLFHEFYHVMLDRDNRRPVARAEEELACDVWAREFLTAKISAYAVSTELNYTNKVLKRRSLSFVLAALILHEITPIWEQGGNQYYPSMAVRMRAIFDNTLLPPSCDFWYFASAVLIGICRQKQIPFDPPAMSARELTDFLLKLI